MKTKIVFAIGLLLPMFISCNKNLNLSPADDGGFVDLGLSVKWAKCNAGATSPEKAGKYYGIIYEDGNLKVDDTKGLTLPTLNEMMEFQSNCKISYTSYNGVNGFLAVGPNGNSIFIPGIGRQGSAQSGIPDYSNEDFTYLWTGTKSNVDIKSETGDKSIGCNYYLCLDAKKSPVSCIRGVMDTGVVFYIQCREVRR